MAAFPLWPFFREAFGDELCIVHLTRHPVYWAFSQMTHGYYSEVRKDNYVRLMQLAPTDAGVSLKEYAPRWQHMDQLEKCYYMWCEINKYESEIFEMTDPGHRLRIAYERWFAVDADLLERITTLAGLPHRPELLQEVGNVEDKYYFVLRSHREPDAETLSRYALSRLHRQPRVTALARDLGYDTSTVDGSYLRRRYVQGSAARDVM